MSAPANRWKLGLFVLAGFGLSIAGFTWLGVHELKRDSHTAWAYFDEALTGLDEGSPVRFRGVRIGVVERIDPAKEDRRHLVVQMSLYDDKLSNLGLALDQTDRGEPLNTNLRAQVVMSWVTGTAFVQVDFFPDPSKGPQQLPFECAPNTLRTVPSTAKSLEDAGREVLRELPAMASSGHDLLELLRSDLQAARVPELAARFDRLLAALETEVKDLRQLGTVAAATSALEAVRDAARSLQAEQGPLLTTLREMQGMIADVRSELRKADAGGTAASVRNTADKSAALAAVFTALGEDLRGELVHLRAALDAVQRLAELLERDPGALLHGRGTAPTSPLEGTKR